MKSFNYKYLAIFIVFLIKSTNTIIFEISFKVFILNIRKTQFSNPFLQIVLAI